ADRPQLVLVVKIDNPHKGSYFAAQSAAPVTRSMLEQALVARTVALVRARVTTAAPPATAIPADDDGGLVSYVLPWPYQPDSAGDVVLRRAWFGARRARVRDGRARAGRRRGAGGARAAGGDAADPGARRAARRGRRGGSVVRPPRGEARSGGRHGDERQDDVGH